MLERPGSRLHGRRVNNFLNTHVCANVKDAGCYFLGLDRGRACSFLILRHFTWWWMTTINGPKGELWLIVWSFWHIDESLFAPECYQFHAFAAIVGHRLHACFQLALFYIAAGQNPWYHFEVGAPPILVYFSGDWDVHWGYGALTHGHMHCVET